MTVDYKQIGKRIRIARRKVNITQAELAEKLGVSIGYISQIERGITKANLITLDDLCDCIKCDLIYILSGTNTEESRTIYKAFYKEFSKLSEKDKHTAIKIIEVLNKR